MPLVRDNLQMIGLTEHEKPNISRLDFSAQAPPFDDELMAGVLRSMPTLTEITFTEPIYTLSEFTLCLPGKDSAFILIEGLTNIIDTFEKCYTPSEMLLTYRGRSIGRSVRLGTRSVVNPYTKSTVSGNFVSGKFALCGLVDKEIVGFGLDGLYRLYPMIAA